MIFNQHLSLEGTHAPFGASKHAWIRYSDDKFIDVYKNLKASEIGTRKHELAAEMIRLGQKAGGRDYFTHYVNDAIGYHMTPEVILFYSELFYGTADAIRFDEKKSLLRIHDLKTGVTPVSMEQLYIYVALFCLEYHIRPGDIQIETRIYQVNQDIVVDNPTASDIAPIMDKMIHITKLIHDQELKNIV